MISRPHGLTPARHLYPWDSPGKNTGVGCSFPPLRRSGSSWPKEWSRVSRIAGRFPSHLGSPKGYIQSVKRVTTSPKWSQALCAKPASSPNWNSLPQLVCFSLWQDVRISLEFPGGHEGVREPDRIPSISPPKWVNLLPLDESERGEWKDWLKTQHSKY